MLETIIDRQHRTIKGNRTLIALRLLLATLSLMILLMQESIGSRALPGSRRVVSAAGEVPVVIFGPDGKRLYSGGSDGTVRVWDVASSAEAMGAIEGHGDSVLALALSPHGARLASGSADRTARIHATQDGRFIAQVPAQDGAISVLAWSSDGSKLLTGGDCPLRLWSIPNGSQSVKALARGGKTTSGAVFAAFLSGDGVIVSAGSDGVIRFWNSEDLSLTGQWEAHIRPINAAAISPDKSRLVTGGSILRLWDLAGRREIRASEAHAGEITGLSFDGTGTRFFSGGQDHQLMLWSTSQPKELKSFDDREETILSVALSPDGTQAAVSGADRTIGIFDVHSGRLINELAGHRKTLRISSPNLGAKFESESAPSSLYLRPEWLVVFTVLVLTLLYSLALKKAELASRLAYLQVFVDIGLISALVYDTGGVDSPFVTLYLVSITAAAFVLSWRGAILMAALAATLFALITLAYGVGQIPTVYILRVGEAHVRKFRDPGLLDYIRLLLLPICAFFLIAILAGNLAGRLAVARLLHHEVLEGIGEGILVLDLDSRVLYHNQEIRKLLAVGHPLERCHLRDLLGPVVDEQAQRVLKEGRSRRLEISHRRPDAMILPFEVRLIPVLDPDGPPRGLIAVLDDITAEKKMEEFFKHKERIDAMGQISATIAHEIRNPLASIRGAVQEIARSVEIPESKKILIEIVLSESDRLDQIITDFLRYARMRAPKLTSVDVVQLLTDLRLLLVSRPEAKEMQITLEAPEDVRPILADAEQLRQVFLNLGVNAMQALDGRSERRITLSVKSSSLYGVQGLDRSNATQRVDRRGVCIEVKDTGGGMPQEIQDQIFEPFYTTKANGTGLGLAIVARIVQGHEGVIRVESETGKGTTFLIWLPGDLNAESGAMEERPSAVKLSRT